MLRILSVLIVILVFISCNTSVVKKEMVTVPSSPLPSLYVLKEKVNLREKASSRSAKITTLEDGQELFVKENRNGWYKISTEEGLSGWVYSKLAGPVNLSPTRMASAFVDSVLPAFGVEMFFDKKELYKTVYLTLPASYYASPNKAKKFAAEIGKAYQKKVFHGAVKINVLKPQSKDIFLKFKLKAIGPDNIPLPEIKTGYLAKIEEKNKQVRIFIAVNDSINNKILLKSARSISAQYDYPFTKSEIYFISDTAEGLSFIKDMNKLPRNRRVCRLYYIEDKNGEDYHFDFCFEKR